MGILAGWRRSPWPVAVVAVLVAAGTVRQFAESHWFWGVMGALATVGLAAGAWQRHAERTPSR